MGNALRFLCGNCGKPTVEEEQAGTESLGPHGVTADTVGVSALAHDLFHFEITSQVPEGLNQRVGLSRKAQAKWYGKLLNAWKESKPPPKTPEEAARLIIKTLHKHQQAEVEGLLAFYGLPLPDTLIELETSDAQLWAEGVKFEFQTLPVDVKCVGDGDSFTVYVDTTDPMVSASVPIEIHEAAIERSNARAVKNYGKADELQKKMVDAGYRVINGPNNEEILAQKYRIRLRGIDAPESLMDFGEQAKEELAKLLQGKCLTVHAYGEDRYGRCVADVYCNGIFVQEYMLKKGLAWHYIAYDRRTEFASWERDARAASIGLWALPNPQKPWDWRRDQRNNASMETRVF